MTVREAAKKLFGALAYPTWVSSVGIGEKDGKQTIYVYVTSKKAASKAMEEQKEFEGFPIVVEQIGKVRPLHH